MDAYRILPLGSTTDSFEYFLTDGDLSPLMPSVTVMVESLRFLLISYGSLAVCGSELPHHMRILGSPVKPYPIKSE